MHQQPEERVLMAPAQQRRHETFQHKLEQFDPGMVWLDANNRVLALNDTALRILGPAAEHSLGVDPDTLLGLDVLQMHPDKSRDKLRLLLQAGNHGGCPMKSPPPVAMMINIPDRVLVLKVSRMTGAAGTCGTCMIFYDLTDITTVVPEPATARSRNQIEPEPAPRRLFKIPVYRKNRVILIDLKDVVRFQADGHYTAIVTRDDHYLSNLSLTDLEERLDGSVYFRTHRSHIVSLANAVELLLGEDSVSLVMADRDNTVVPVSRPNTVKLKELLGMTLSNPKNSAEKRPGSRLTPAG